MKNKIDKDLSIKLCECGHTDLHHDRSGKGKCNHTRFPIMCLCKKFKEKKGNVKQRERRN